MKVQGKIYSKQTSYKHNKDKQLDKFKDINIINPQLQNIFSPNKSSKSKINNSQSLLERKMSVQNYNIDKNNSGTKNILKEKSKKEKRIFSLSPKNKLNEKENEIIKNNNNNEINKNLNNEYINVNINSESYGFDLYKHLKENLRNKDKLCKDKLTKDSFYCLDCKLSTCKKCLNYNIHKGHNLVPKYLYFNYDENIFNKCFYSIDSIFENNDKNFILNNQKLKEEMKNLIKDSFDNIIKRLEEIKIKKLNEIEKLFESTDGCVEYLKEKENNIKEDIKNYMTNQKEFYNIQIEEEISTKASSERTKNNQESELINNLKIEAINESQSNKDKFNTIFLTNYDLFKNTEYINGEIRKLIDDIESNKNKYMKYFDENIKLINSELDKFNDDFTGVFNFRY